MQPLQRPQTRVTSWASRPKGAITNASRTEELPVIHPVLEIDELGDVADEQGSGRGVRKKMEGLLSKSEENTSPMQKGNRASGSNGIEKEAREFPLHPDHTSPRIKASSRMIFRRHVPPLQLESDGSDLFTSPSPLQAFQTLTSHSLAGSDEGSAAARRAEYALTLESELKSYFRGLDEKMDYVSNQVNACLDGLTRVMPTSPGQARRMMRGRPHVHRPGGMRWQTREGSGNYQMGSGTLRVPMDLDLQMASNSASRDIATPAFASQQETRTSVGRRVSFSNVSPRTAEGQSQAPSEFQRRAGSHQGSDFCSSDGDAETCMTREESAATQNLVGTPWAGLRSLMSGGMSMTDLTLDGSSVPGSRRSGDFAKGKNPYRRGFFFQTLSHKPSDLASNHDSSPMAFQSRKVISVSRKDKVDKMAKADAFFSTRQQRGQIAEQVWSIIDDPESSSLAWIYSVILRVLVLGSVVLSLVQTFRSPFLEDIVAGILEVTIDSLFLLDITCRFLTCPSRTNFLFNFYNAVDLLSISALPLRVHRIIGEVERDGLIYYILFCIVPVFRLLKSLRGFQTFKLLLSAFKRAFEALPVLLFTLLTIVMTFSAMIYVVEPRSNIESLPDSMYFTVVTITTVGYGDVNPISPEGKTIVCALVIIGVLYMAMPIGIIGSAFNEVWGNRDKILLMLRVRDRMYLWGYKPSDIPLLFHLFDKNTDGELTLDDFRVMIREMKLGLSEERIVQLFQSFDVDLSGTIDAPEFIRHLFPGAYHQLFEVPTHPATDTSSGQSELLRASMPGFRLADMLKVRRASGDPAPAAAGATHNDKDDSQAGFLPLQTLSGTPSYESTLTQSDRRQRQVLLQVPVGNPNASAQNSLRSGMSPVNEVASSATSMTNPTSSRGGSGATSSMGSAAASAGGAPQASVATDESSVQARETSGGAAGFIHLDSKDRNDELTIEMRVVRPSTPDSGGGSTSMPMLPLELDGVRQGRGSKAAAAASGSRASSTTAAKCTVALAGTGFSAEL